MKRFAATIAGLSLFAMLVLDSSACYLIMLTCNPAVRCATPSVVEQSGCQSRCGSAISEELQRCEADESTPVMVCGIRFSSETAMRQSCECQLASPPLTSTAAERKTPEMKSAADVQVGFGSVADQSSHDDHLILSRPTGIHPTIPTTVLRC